MNGDKVHKSVIPNSWKKSCLKKKRNSPQSHHHYQQQKREADQRENDSSLKVNTQLSPSAHAGVEHIYTRGTRSVGWCDQTILLAGVCLQGVKSTSDVNQDILNRPPYWLLAQRGELPWPFLLNHNLFGHKTTIFVKSEFPTVAVFTGKQMPKSHRLERDKGPYRAHLRLYWVLGPQKQLLMDHLQVLCDPEQNSV